MTDRLWDLAEGVRLIDHRRRLHRVGTVGIGGTLRLDLGGIRLLPKDLPGSRFKAHQEPLFAQGINVPAVDGRRRVRTAFI